MRPYHSQRHVEMASVAIGRLMREIYHELSLQEFRNFTGELLPLPANCPEAR